MSHQERLEQKYLDFVAGLATTPPVECEFRVGDIVTFTNEYGLVFKGHRIIGFAEDTSLNGRFIHTVNDAVSNAYWLPKEPEELTMETSHETIEQRKALVSDMIQGKKAEEELCDRMVDIAAKIYNRNSQNRDMGRWYYEGLEVNDDKTYDVKWSWNCNSSDTTDISVPWECVYDDTYLAKYIEEKIVEDQKKKEQKEREQQEEREKQRIENARQALSLLTPEQRKEMLDFK